VIRLLSWLTDASKAAFTQLLLAEKVLSRNDFVESHEPDVKGRKMSKMAACSHMLYIDSG
jgi:hypothetical protein